MQSSREVELKFDAGVDWVLGPIDGLVVVAEQDLHLSAHYWDTPDLRLLKRGVTLRHRLADDGSENGWTLKLTSTVHPGRELWREEITMDGPSGEVPVELWDLVRIVALGNCLEPVAALETRRRVRRLGRDMWTAEVELSDDTVTSSIGATTGPAFREIEVELLEAGAQRSFDTVVSVLGEMGLEPSEQRPKLARVLGATPEPTRVKPSLESSATIRELVSTIASTHAEQLIAVDPWLRWTDDAEVVHRARKATRRFRSQLKALRPVMRRSEVEPLRGELRWYGALLGELRDLDVMKQLLSSLMVEIDNGVTVDDGSGAQLVGLLDVQREHRRDVLLSALRGDRYLGLVTAIVEFAGQPPLRRSVDPEMRAADFLVPSGRKAWRRAHEAARVAKRTGTAEDLHTLRKKVKHVRAVAEMAQLVELRSKGFLRASGTVKDHLGDHHDTVVMADWLDRVHSRCSPSAAYVAGRCRERVERRRLNLESSWRRTWRGLDRRRLRRWIRPSR